MATTSTINGADTASNIQSASTPVTTNNANSADSLQNEFLTLMVAQVQNQDPLNPADGTEYVSQLAQFSQVQSTENLVTLMQNNAVMMDNMQVLTTASLVDQEVSVRTDQLAADGETTYNGTIELAAASNTVTLQLTDETGLVVNVPLGAQPSGVMDYSLDSKALGLSGNYSMEVLVDEGQNYYPTITVKGTVSSVSIPSTGGASILNVAGVGDVPFYEITTFGTHSE
ncbi:MAG: flagellar hook assembly protein FlgD [Vibrio sp.]